MANQIKSVAQLVLENKGNATRKRKAEELSFKKSLASSSNSINKEIHNKKVKLKDEKKAKEIKSLFFSSFIKHQRMYEAQIGRLLTEEEVDNLMRKAKAAMVREFGN